MLSLMRLTGLVPPVLSFWSVLGKGAFQLAHGLEAMYLIITIAGGDLMSPDLSCRPHTLLHSPHRQQLLPSAQQLLTWPPAVLDHS